MVFASEDYDAAISYCQLQVEEFLHREQNAQIADLRKAASEMIQKVLAFFVMFLTLQLNPYLVSRRS
jgi:hypothetical protein